MDKVEEPTASSPSGQARTPAFAIFESSTDKLFALLQFILHGIRGFNDALEHKVTPEVMSIAEEIAQVGKAASDQEARDSADPKNIRRAEAHQPLYGRFTDGTRVDSGAVGYDCRGISRGRTDLCGQGRCCDYGIFTGNCAIRKSGRGTILRGTKRRAKRKITTSMG